MNKESLMEEFSQFIIKNFENGDSFLIETTLLAIYKMFKDHPKTFNYFNQHKLL